MAGSSVKKQPVKVAQHQRKSSISKPKEKRQVVEKLTKGGVSFPYLGGMEERILINIRETEEALRQFRDLDFL